jgi:hypothetical protein
VSPKRLPQTTAYVRVTDCSWQQGNLEGEVSAGAFTWQFCWQFRQARLAIEPSQGRALIQEPLGRFLEQRDYQLEPGGDYYFTIRAEI